MKIGIFNNKNSTNEIFVDFEIFLFEDFPANDFQFHQQPILKISNFKDFESILFFGINFSMVSLPTEKTELFEFSRFINNLLIKNTLINVIN